MDTETITYLQKLGFGPLFVAKKTVELAPSAEEAGNKDLTLWHKWNDGGRKKRDMKPVLRSLRPIINMRMNPYLHANIKGVPKEVIKSRFESAAIRAIKEYDPGRKAKLSTFATYKLRDAEHHIKKYQNVGSIPDHRASKVGQLQTTFAVMRDAIGREPTPFELAEELQWPEREVARLQNELRSDWVTSRSEEATFQIPPDLDEMGLRLIKYELPDEEKLVFQHLMGMDGFDQMKPGQIAKQYKWSPAKVSSLKGKIEKRMKDRGI